jgi:ubiquinone/menaquinone biosynthesis C-methylase UbiE
MLEMARSKPLPFGTSGSVDWIQLSAAEIEDRFAPASFDAVTACLVLSELSTDDIAYALEIAFTRICPGGRLVVADEVAPFSAVQRFLYRVGRIPLVVATYLLTQTTTRAVSGLADRVCAAGYVGVGEERPWPAFAIVSGSRPAEVA